MRPYVAIAAASLILGASTVTAIQIAGVRVHEVPLRKNDPSSPWCYAASIGGDGDCIPAGNFLATQVWPSARHAAWTLEEHADPCWAVCELGCGPGLPSLAVARKRKGSSVRSVATDLDPFALRMVEAAAAKQKLDLSTQLFDLTSDDPLPPADLYLLSDVFESSHVARGAAAHTRRALRAGARVWVFAQSDRAQREVYLSELRFGDDSDLEWSSKFVGDRAKLWLCDVDETAVKY